MFLKIYSLGVVLASILSIILVVGMIHSNPNDKQWDTGDWILFVAIVTFFSWVSIAVIGLYFIIGYAYLIIKKIKSKKNK